MAGVTLLTLAAVFLLVVLGQQVKERHQRKRQAQLTWETARKRSMEAQRDRQLCREIERKEWGHW